MKKIQLEKLDSCLLCGSKNLTDLFETETPSGIADVSVKKFVMCKCEDCTFQFINPRPISKHIDYYYPDEYEEFHESKDTLLDKIYLLARKLTKKPVKVIPGGKLLDIGFGYGDYLIAKYKHGWDAYGVDISKYAYNNLKKKYPALKLTHADLEGAHYDKNTFDYIHAHAVLEHVYDPLKFLQEIHRVLKPGGKVYIMIPNVNGLYYKLAGENAEFVAPQHLVFFTEQTIKEALERVGFNNFNIKPDFGNLTSHFIVKSLGFRTHIYQRSVAKQILGLFIHVIETSFQIGDVLVVTATK